jgi:hypothetical protein
VDQATFRILDTLSRKLGGTLSINQLTSEIMQHYGTGYYARTYNKLNDLSKQGLIQLTKAGRSSIPSLNFSSYILLDLLSEVEIRKKVELLESSKTLQPLLMDMETFAHCEPQIESISLINPAHNTRLNRAELLILLHDTDHTILPDMLIHLHSALRGIQNLRMIRIDTLPLTTKEFRSQLTSQEINPLKEMLSNRITFYNPRSFWLTISEILRSSGKIVFETEETNPAKISKADIYYNLSRFGYKELGIQPEQGRSICIEYTTAAVMTGENARLAASIPIILAKNNADYSLLIFLSVKFGFAGKLLGVLGTLATLKPTKEVAAAIRILESLGTKAAKADLKDIERKMRLYHAVR